MPAFPQSAAQVAPLSEASIGAKDGKLGRLKWISGQRITSADARIRSVTGLEFDPTYGVIAVTAARDWLSVNATADGPTSVGVAPMAQPPGTPDGLVNDTSGLISVHFAGLGVRSYALRSCGQAAKPIEAANESSSIDGTIAAKVPAMPGWRLKDVSEADRFSPDDRPGVEDIFLVWRPEAGGDKTILQEFSNSGPAQSKPTELARLSRPVGGMAAIYVVYGEVRIVIAIASDTPGVLDLYAFSVDNAVAR